MSQQQNKPNTPPAGPPATVSSLNGLLAKFKDQIAVALPKHMTAERMIRVGLTAVSRTPLLQKCTPVSIAGALVQASIMGLEPDGLSGQAYLIPFYNSKLEVPGGKKGGYECQVQVGYKGLVKLARNSGEYSIIDAQPVHANDFFEFEKGSTVYWKHKWERNGDRGPIDGYWAGYVLKDGGKNFEYWTVSQIEEHRDQYSQGAYLTKWNSEKRQKEFVLDDNGHMILQGPWAESPDWMYRKTPLKQVLKLGPSSYELQAAQALDDISESGKRQTFTLEVPLELGPGPEVNDEDEGGESESGRGSRSTIVMPERKSATDTAKTEPVTETKSDPPPVSSRGAFRDACDALAMKYPLRFFPVLGLIGWEKPDDVPVDRQAYVLGELGKELES